MSDSFLETAADEMHQSRLAANMEAQLMESSWQPDTEDLLLEDSQLAAHQTRLVEDCERDPGA